MSNFLKRGKREQVRKNNKEIKKRTKDFYVILHELDGVARILSNLDEDINEDNILDVASRFTTRKLEAMEKLVLLGKVEQYGKNVRNG